MTAETPTSGEGEILRPSDLTPAELRCLIATALNEIAMSLNRDKLLRSDLEKPYKRLGLWISGFPEAQIPFDLTPPHTPENTPATTQ